MNDQKILVPIDFSEVTKTVIDMAVYIAVKNKMTISLLHLENNKSGSDPYEKMKELASQTQTGSSVNFEFLLKPGNIFHEIARTANDGQFKLMVIGSHGYKGLREKIFGADILKLLRSIPIPVLTVQKNFQIPKNGFEKILFPAGSHDSFIHKIEATIYFAGLFNSEVHLYSVEKPGIEWSDEIRNNIRKAKSEFERKKISYKRVREEQSAFSVGYAKQIMDYAKRVNVDLIAFMANPTKEHFYFADTDKEIMLTNKACIPILSTNDKSVV